MIFVLGLLAYVAGLLIWRHNRITVGGIDLQLPAYREWQTYVGVPLMLVGVLGMGFSILKVLWGLLP